MYICEECNKEYLKFVGKCNYCKNWNSLIKIEESKISSFNNTSSEDQINIHSDINELNNICALKTQAVYVFGGEPGIGKSTFVAQLSVSIKNSVLYLTGEESISSVKERIERVKPMTKKFFKGGDGNNIQVFQFRYVDNLPNLIEKYKPKIIVIDSINTTACEDKKGIKPVCLALANIARKYNICIILTSHITKSGDIAGPKTLEHMVDVVFYLTGNRYKTLRQLRSIKNRYGPTDVVSSLEMTDGGLIPPVQSFIPILKSGAIGSLWSIIVVGNTAIAAQIEALVINDSHQPRVESSGYSLTRVRILLDILKKTCGLKLNFKTIIANLVDNLSTKDHTTDLAIIVAVISSYFNKPVPANSLFIGEVRLTGDILPCYDINHRLTAVNNLQKLKVHANCMKNKEIIQVTHLSHIIGYFKS